MNDIFALVLCDTDRKDLEKSYSFLQVLVRGLEKEPYILVPTSASQLYQFAFRGKDGDRADGVFLAGEYSGAANKDDWKIENDVPGRRAPMRIMANGNILADWLAKNEYPRSKIALLTNGPDAFDSAKFGLKIHKGHLYDDPDGVFSFFKSVFG